MTREIPLTAGKIALVDDEDFESLLGFTWHAVRSSQKIENWYARRTEKGENGKPVHIYMHRVILSASKDQECDHRDHDGLNNRRSNLRLCSRALNCANIRRAPAASGYRGVYYQKKDRRWQAQATVNNKTVNLGTFSDPSDAAKARDAYVAGLYGDFAILNFPVNAVDAP